MDIYSMYSNNVTASNTRQNIVAIKQMDDAQVTRLMAYVKRMK